MTKKDFEAVAALLSDCLEQGGDDPSQREATVRVGNRLTDLFAATYPVFQPARFRQAAGLPE